MHRFFRFLRFGGRVNEWCPNCRSLGRHRLIYLYLEYRTLLLAGQQPARVLHVGPEFCLKPILAGIPHAKYVSIDLMVSIVDWLEVRPDACMSITRTAFPSDVFDLVICSHVLEHVKDDRQAIAELFRITAPGGIAVVPVPVAWNEQATDEREGLTAAQRAALYGEPEHVRRYGRDYLDRLREAGFVADLIGAEDLHSRPRYRINADDPLVIGRKPDKPFLGEKLCVSRLS
jgi:SAM-dependent methyltransferase